VVSIFHSKKFIKNRRKKSRKGSGPTGEKGSRSAEKGNLHWKLFREKYRISLYHRRTGQLAKEPLKEN
tara:strand:- start:269 stop:472 length:204 start_codon:yes stop_codon:yes gene_type:complete